MPPAPGVLRSLLIAAACMAFMLSGCCSKPSATLPADALHRPTGKWSIFSGAADYHWVQAVTTRYLWMGTYAELVRYDAVENKRERFDDRHGLPLSANRIERIRAWDDGSCILLLERASRLLHCSSDARWQRLPDLPGDWRPVDVGFDVDGGMLALARPPEGETGSAIFKLTGRRWQEQRRLALPAYGLVAFKDHWLIKTSFGRRDSGLAAIAKAGNAQPVRVPGILPDENGLGYFRVGGRIYMTATERFGSQAGFPWPRALLCVREITPEGVVTSGDGPQLFDQKKQAFEPFAMALDHSGQLEVKIAGAAPLKLEAREGPVVFPVRDLGGNIWLPDRLFRDGKWEVTTLPTHRELFQSGVVRTDKVWLDEQNQWRRRLPREYAEFRAADASGRRFWALRDTRSATMELLDAQATVLRVLPREPHWSLPFITDAGGNLWLISVTGPLRGADSAIIRISTQGAVKKYAVRSVGDLWLSPTGEIWAASHPENLRLDRATDTWTPADDAALYEAFAFELGGRQWSLIPTGHTVSRTMLMEKVDGRWVEAATYAARSGNRLLLCNGYHGVWEFDAAGRRWVQLSRGLFHVGFDAAGRRILALAASTLVYDGDPFADEAYRHWLPTGEKGPLNLFEASHPLCPKY